MGSTSVEQVPVQQGPSAWTAETLGERAAWAFDLRSFCTEAELRGTCSPHDPAFDAVDVREGVVATAAELPAHFDEVAREVRRRIVDGPGFVVIDGFPVADGGRRRATRLYAWLMARFGRLLPQNTASDDLYLVRTKGYGADKQYGSRGSGELVFHTDQAAAPPELLPAVLGLLCLDRAASGGRTQLASGHALLNALIATDPELVRVLTLPTPFGRDADGVSDAPPLVAQPVHVDSAGRAALRYNRYFIEVGATQLGHALSPAMVETFDAIDEIFEHQPLPLDMLLEPGQALIADNAVIMHNRSAYEDDATHQRLLVRAWT